MKKYKDYTREQVIEYCVRLFSMDQEEKYIRRYLEKNINHISVKLIRTHNIPIEDVLSAIRLYKTFG